MQVPLDWDDLDGAKLELAIARRPAEGDPRGSVLVNPGGPGGSGIELLDYVFLADPFDGLRDHFDIVGWDPRGTNGSEAVDCDAPVDDFRALDPSPDDAKEADELVDAATEIAQDCERAASDRLAHISTDDTVKDMEAIRRALGDERMSFYGFSYGTALGAFYADQFPDRVRAIVLDGVVDPGADLETYLTAQARGFDRALDAMFEACGDACPDGGVAELYDRLADRVERSPIGSGSDTLGPAELATAAISATYSPDGGPAFADALQQADDGDPTALLSLAAQYYSTDYTPYLAIECVDQAHPMGDAEWAAFVERLEGISLRLGGSIGNELLPCANWPVAPVESLVSLGRWIQPDPGHRQHRRCRHPLQPGGSHGRGIGQRCAGHPRGNRAHQLRQPVRRRDQRRLPDRPHAARRRHDLPGLTGRPAPPLGCPVHSPHQGSMHVDWPPPEQRRRGL